MVIATSSYCEFSAPDINTLKYVCSCSITSLKYGSDIPVVIDRATEKSEQRIQFHYNTIIEESSKKKELWIDAQTTAINTYNKPKSADAQEQIRSYISELETISSNLN